MRSLYDARGAPRAIRRYVYNSEKKIYTYKFFYVVNNIFVVSFFFLIKCNKKLSTEYIFVSNLYFIKKNRDISNLFINIVMNAKWFL